jgi:hypothetical protein
MEDERAIPIMSATQADIALKCRLSRGPDAAAAAMPGAATTIWQTI